MSVVASSQPGRRIRDESSQSCPCQAGDEPLPSRKLCFVSHDLRASHDWWRGHDKQGNRAQLRSLFLPKHAMIGTGAQNVLCYGTSYEVLSRL